jgi:hypothetical protein
VRRAVSWNVDAFFVLFRLFKTPSPPPPPHTQAIIAAGHKTSVPGKKGLESETLSNKQLLKFTLVKANIKFILLSGPNGGNSCPFSKEGVLK